MALSAEEIAGIALEIMQRASDYPLQYFRAPLKVDAKADMSPVTIADRNTEEFIRKELKRAFPEDGILGEEFGSENLDADAIWIVDPIDGTKSFISGHPLFGMLLGRYVKGEPQVGIVHMPAICETFVGVLGHGANCNGNTITCRRNVPHDEALIYVNDGETLIIEDPECFARIKAAGRLCRLSYDCYPHALVASGQIDAVIDHGLEPYDFLPLVGLVEAAGGIICDWNGAPLHFKSEGRIISAATPAIRDALLHAIHG